jgi:hypothetical protein
MDLVSWLVWDYVHDRQIADMRDRLDQMQTQKDLARWDAPNLKDLAQENLELKLRLGLLVRLLISKGVITAEEYAAQLASARPTA